MFLNEKMKNNTGKSSFEEKNPILKYMKDAMLLSQNQYLSRNINN